MQLFIIIVQKFFSVLSWLIIIRIIASWFIRGGNSQIYHMLCLATDPILLPFRKLTMRFSANTGLDFSPLLAILALNLLQTLVIYLARVFL